MVDGHPNLGHEIARNTIKRILQEHRIDPAPERSQRTPWATQAGDPAQPDAGPEASKAWVVIGGAATPLRFMSHNFEPLA